MIPRSANAMKFFSVTSLIFLGCTISCRGFTQSLFQPTSKHHSRTNLFGLSNVNDYFNSFSNNGDDENEESKKDGTELSDAVGSSLTGAESQGSAYANVNDYFRSFDKPVDDTNTAAGTWHGKDNFRQEAEEVQNDKFTPQSISLSEHMTISEVAAYNNARLCPKMLLTQCSIQTFSYLLEECRDPHSGKWLEDFLNVQGLMNYHGNGAFNITRYPTWDSLLLDLIRQPNEKMIVSAKRRGRGHGGWSKNNPYLQERWVEFAINIQPASLVQRLLPVRQQLSMEFEKDLDIVQTVDGMIMDSYFSRIKSESMLDSSTQPSRFERISVHILTNNTSFHESESSPLRKGNFDLLYSLCTHASAHELLRQLRDDSRDGVTFEWFKKFYEEHISEYFDGDQPFGRADDFIDALLCTPPSFIELPGKRSPEIVDPLALAERMISIRSEISEEWKYQMQEVKNDHAWLNDKLVRAMLGKSIENSQDIENEKIEIAEDMIFQLPDDVGEFE